MQLEDFKTLIEVQSLQKYIKQILDKINEENQRILRVKVLRENRHQESLDQASRLQLLTKSINSRENELYAIEKKLKHSQEQASMAKNEHEVLALEKQLTQLKAQRDELQDTLFQDMELQEELENALKASQNFLSGSVTSLNEIEQEVQLEVSLLESKIAGYNQRITDLLEQLPKAAQSLFLQVDKKFRFNSPLAFIQQKHCSVCKLEIDAITRQQIENQLSLETCSGCGRLLIPPSAQTSL